MIDRTTVDKIFDAAQIVEVVSDFVSLRKRGINYIGLCPFHDERTPSFSVSPSKGIFKCFSCGKGGNAVHFIMEHEQMTYVEALRYLAKKYHIEIQEKEISEEERLQQTEREGMFILNEYARDFFAEQLYNHPEGVNLGLSYFRERGFREDIIRKFQLGYVPEQRGFFSNAAVAKGYNRDLLLKTGLSLENDRRELNDRFRGRVMFPVHTLSGKIVAFGGRVLKQGEKTAKYVNSPESVIYHKSEELYGIYFAKSSIVKQDHCFLVEGYTDVISMHQAGIENVVASSGTALTPGQIKKIQRFTNNLTVLYDGDNAGIKASLRGIDLLLKEGMNIKVALLPDGDDPDSYAKKHSSSEFMAFIEEAQVDFIRFKTNLLLKEAGNDPIKRAGLIRSIVDSIAIIPDQIVRSVYIRECSSLLSMSEDILIQEVNKLKRADIEKRLNDEMAAEARRKAEASVVSAAASHSSEFERRGAVPVPPPIGPVDDVYEGGDSSFLPPPPMVEMSGQEGAFVAPPMGDYASAISPMEDSSVSSSAYELPNEDRELEVLERSIIECLLRHGDKICYNWVDDDQIERCLNVSAFILSKLQAEEIAFRNPYYQRIFDEMIREYTDPNFVPDRYFSSHPDPQISRLAVDLITDRYLLSKIYSHKPKKVKEGGQDVIVEPTQQELKERHRREQERLFEHCVRVMTELINARINKEVRELEFQLRSSASEEETMGILHRLTDALQKKRQLAKSLGDRILV